MPTQNVVLADHQAHLVESRESKDQMRLSALRDAAKVGIADIEADNFRRFDSAEVLGQHLATLTSELIGT